MEIIKQAVSQERWIEIPDEVMAGIDQVLKWKETGEEKAIVIGFSGHGYFDLAAYDSYPGGSLEDYAYPKEKTEEALVELPDFEANLKL